MKIIPVQISPNFPAKTRKTLYSLFTTILVTAFFLGITFKDMDWHVFSQTIRSVNFKFMLFLLPFASLNYFLRSLRWKILLSQDKNLEIRNVYFANMIGYLGNAFLPARMGEFIRTFLISKKENLLIPFVLTTALVERIIDFIILICGFVIALLYLPNVPYSFSNALKKMGIFGILGLLLIIILPNSLSFFMSKIFLLPIPSKFRTKILNISDGFIKGTTVIRSKYKLFIYLLYTIIIWAMDTVGAIFIAWMIHYSLSYSQAFILLACLGISSAIPATPGYIGVYQFVAQMVLAPFGFLKSDALAYILLLQGTNYSVVLLWGILGIIYLKFKKDS